VVNTQACEGRTLGKIWEVLEGIIVGFLEEAVHQRQGRREDSGQGMTIPGRQNKICRDEKERE
jgi:hypothetical protein